MVDLVQIRGLAKTFESRKGLFGKSRSLKAVSAVDLDIPRGKVTGVVGESGCGKSTLARLVVRLLRPSDGRITFDGLDLQRQSNGEMRRLRRRMQMVFQDPYSAIDPRYTIADALLEPFQVQGIRLSSVEARAKVAELLDIIGFSGYLVEPARQAPRRSSRWQRHPRRYFLPVDRPSTNPIAVTTTPASRIFKPKASAISGLTCMPT